MAKTSAGLLLFRYSEALSREGSAGIEVLIAHPGGPFWSKRQTGAWSVPKGEFDPAREAPQIAAAREFSEEVGMMPPREGWIDLGEVLQKSGKVVTAWAVEGDFDPADLNSETFALEWPRSSGNWIDVPEVDEVRWCKLKEARALLNPAQVAFVERLAAHR